MVLWLWCWSMLKKVRWPLHWLGLFTVCQVCPASPCSFADLSRWNWSSALHLWKMARPQLKWSTIRSWMFGVANGCRSPFASLPLNKPTCFFSTWGAWNLESVYIAVLRCSGPFPIYLEPRTLDSREQATDSLDWLQRLQQCTSGTWLGSSWHAHGGPVQSGWCCWACQTLQAWLNLFGRRQPYVLWGWAITLWYGPDDCLSPLHHVELASWSSPPQSISRWRSWQCLGRASLCGATSLVCEIPRQWRGHLRSQVICSSINTVQLCQKTPSANTDPWLLNDPGHLSVHRFQPARSPICCVGTAGPILDHAPANPGKQDRRNVHPNGQVCSFAHASRPPAGSLRVNRSNLCSLQKCNNSKPCLAKKHRTEWRSRHAPGSWPLAPAWTICFWIVLCWPLDFRPHWCLDLVGMPSWLGSQLDFGPFSACLGVGHLSFVGFGNQSSRWLQFGTAYSCPTSWLEKWSCALFPWPFGLSAVRIFWLWGVDHSTLIAWAGALSGFVRHFVIQANHSPGVASQNWFPEGCALSCMAMVALTELFHKWFSATHATMRPLSYVDNRRSFWGLWTIWSVRFKPWIPLPKPWALNLMQLNLTVRLQMETADDFFEKAGSVSCFRAESWGLTVSAPPMHATALDRFREFLA